MRLCDIRRLLFRSVQPSDGKAKGKKLKKKKKKATREADAEGIAVTSVKPLSYRQLNRGMVVLGCVSSVGEYELKVSLPGHLVGSVAITDVSGPYTKALQTIADCGEDVEEVLTLAEMFSPGQVVACAVEKVDSNDTGFFKVSLSLDPRSVQGALPRGAIRKGLVLQAAVASVEDHGFIMDVGVAGVRAFLPHKKVEKYVGQILRGRLPRVGQVLPTVVSKFDASSSRTATLSCELGKLRSTLVDPSDLSLHTMYPGTSVSVQVKKALPGGVMVTFGDFTGYLHRDHFTEELEEDQYVDARILYVLPMVNVIHMSCKPHFNFGKLPSVQHLEDVGVGYSTKDAEVIHRSQAGLVVRLSESIPLGFVSARQVTEGEIPNLKEKYPVGSAVACRVIQYDYADGMYICSMQKSVLEQGTLSSGLLKPGDRVTCRAKHFVPKGLVVEVGKNRDAFIPLLHLSDVPLKNLEKKIPPGTKLTCRVLRVKNETKKLHLTNKSILVKEDYPVISDYDIGNEGVQTEGVVVSVKSNGLLLQLFGDATGWVPKSRMSTEPIEYPEKLFFLGQVLKCLVVSVDPEKQRMILSLILGGHHKPLGSKKKREGDKMKLGYFYDCTVMDASSDGLSVEIKHEDDGHITKAFLPKNHLTDHPALADKLLASYRVGEVIRDTLCFERDVLPIMTVKPILKEVVRSANLPKSFGDVHEGGILPGVVSNVTSYGAFLRLPTWHFRKNALVPTRYLADFFVDDPKEFVTVHQTMYAKVVQKDEAEEKLTMSTRLADVLKETDDGVSLLSSYLEDSEKAKKAGALSVFRVGLVVSATVVLIRGDGMETDVQGVPGKITKHGLSELQKEPRVGDVLSCVILFLDIDKGCLELSASPEVVKRARQAGSKKLKVDSTLRGSVVLSKPEFHFATVCVWSGSSSGRFVHIPTRRSINECVGQGKSCVVGDYVSILVKEVGGKTVIGVMGRKQPMSKAAKRRRDSLTREDVQPSKKKRLSPVSTGSLGRRGTDSEVLLQKERLAEEAQRTESLAANLPPPEKEDPGWNNDFDPWNEKEKCGAVDKENMETATNKVKTHISKKEKKLLDKLEAEQIARVEQRVLDGEDTEPDTPEEFDRLVLASPNSSLCWIKYMAFYMEKKELGKAREVTSRALEKINFREGEERLNVYMAWLNLENTLGDEESTENLLAEALKYNDQYKVYIRAATAFEQSGNPEKAEKLYKILARRFCKETEPWILLGTHYFSVGNMKEARFTLQRSIQNLERKEHVNITAKFGQLEFKVGEVERGKTVFETILDNYPSRTDLWSVYADALIKAGEMEAARGVFERMISLRMPPKKMKFFFKKYLAFEEAHGDQQGIDKVRKKALEYVEGTVGIRSDERSE